MGSLPSRISIHKKRRPYMALSNKYEGGCFAIMVSEIGRTGEMENLLLVEQNHLSPIYRTDIYKLLLRAANNRFRNYWFCPKFEYTHLHDIQQHAALLYTHIICGSCNFVKIVNHRITYDKIQCLYI